MRLAQVEQFQVPAKIVRQTEETLRAAGAKGCEAFVLWSGRQNGPLFNILTVHVPKQNAYCLSSGLCVRVDGDELHRLNVWLYEADEILAIQIHAHPDEAYHSETDDTYPILATLVAFQSSQRSFAALVSSHLQPPYTVSRQMVGPSSKPISFG